MIPTSCALISEDLLIDCINPLQAGTKDRMLIFNYDDWAQLGIVKNVTNKQIIEDITLVSGVSGYVIQGINNSNTPKNSMKKSKFLNAFTHNVGFIVFRLGAAIKQQLENVARGRFVVIVENNYEGDNGECSYEIYGMSCGLICSSLTRDPSNADSQGGYELMLETSDVNTENHFPATLFITDYPTTKAIFDALAS